MDGFDPAHFAHLAAVEERHAWFRARRELIGNLAEDLTRDLPPHYRVLEVGCGTGHVLRALEQACSGGQVIGMDVHVEGLHFARQRTACQLVLGDANAPPFGAEFALVGLFDVLEHLPDDGHVLRRMFGLLQPHGVLMLTVPADPALWSYFDESSRHVRRYEVPDLERKLRAAGFTVEYITPYMQLLAPIMQVWRRAVPRLGDHRQMSRELSVIPVANDVLYWLLKREAAHIQQRRVLPYGASILAVARRGGV